MWSHITIHPLRAHLLSHKASGNSLQLHGLIAIIAHWSSKTKKTNTQTRRRYAVGIIHQMHCDAAKTKSKHSLKLSASLFWCKLQRQRARGHGRHTNNRCAYTKQGETTYGAWCNMWCGNGGRWRRAQNNANTVMTIMTRSHARRPPPWDTITRCPVPL